MSHLSLYKDLRRRSALSWLYSLHPDTTSSIPITTYTTVFIKIWLLMFQVLLFISYCYLLTGRYCIFILNKWVLIQLKILIWKNFRWVKKFTFWGPNDCVFQESWNGNIYSIVFWQSCFREGKASSLTSKRICSSGKIFPHLSNFIGSLGPSIYVWLGKGSRAKLKYRVGRTDIQVYLWVCR